MDISIDGIQKLMKYSSYAVILWAFSWIVFFLMLPFMVKIFGKVQGTTINYALSWVTPIPLLIVLTYYHKNVSLENPVGMN